MDEKRVNRANLIVKIGSAVILAIVLGYILYEVLVIKPEEIGLAYKIIIGTGVVLIWFLADIFAPLYAREFAVKTPEQISAYKKYAALGLVGYAGLIYFASAMNRENGFYGALVFVGSVMLKRKQKEIYDGEANEDEEDEEASAEEMAEEAIDAASAPEGAQLTSEETETPVRSNAPKSVMESYQSAVRLVDSVEDTEAITYEVESEKADEASKTDAAEENADPQ